MPTFSTLIGPLLLAGTILFGGSTAGVRADDGGSGPPPVPVEKLSFCDEDVAKGRDISDRLLYVTTLDGRLSALDLINGGSLLWSVETGPGALLSSSIHRLELTNNGKWVRMIPSLSGGLYKFDGDTVEPIPFSAEDLLNSSFKFSDDLVISGGKETRSYGVSTRTGHVIYECTMRGCRNATEILEENVKNGPPREGAETVLQHDPLQDDVVVIRRQTQTVRAVESRTGSERWNFSIGHHELEMLKNEDCRGGEAKDSLDAAILDLELKVVIPEGVICAVRKTEPGVIVWQYKFEHPIVSAWRAGDKNDIMSVDLFRGADWVWNANGQSMGGDDGGGSNNGMINPSLYLGMHQKQLYIQESTALMVRQTLNAQTVLLTDEGKFPSIPWKPYPARPKVMGYLTDGSEQDRDAEDSQYAESTAIARSVLYQSNYVNGDGFFLFTPEDLDRKDHELCSNSSTTPAITDGGLQNESSIFDFAMDPDAPVKVIIISIWFWWKEILVISATTAFLLNVMLRFKSEKEVVVFVERQIEVPVPMAVEATEEEFAPLEAAARNTGVRSLSESNSENFVSRFQEDFELVQCLGKGGFGVVFEVKNKLDDCHYAIKRVVLPNKQESKDRVMREVRTLAHCEHSNIVRYFHAWTETPPPGWQESQDKIWIQRNCLSTSIDIETPTEISPPNSKIIFTSDSISQYNHPKHSSGQQPWLTKLPEPSFSLSHTGGIDRSNSCSFIQFQADPGKSLRSDTDDDSFQIEFKHDPADTTDAGGDSMDIVFREPSQNEASNGHHVISISETPQKSAIGPARRFRHRRPVSLDLNSTGSVIRTISTKTHMTDGINTSANYAAASTVNSKIYLYIQMQLCQKQSLKEWLTLNDLSARQNKIIPIFEQIVDAVEYVHLKGLIHRDLKPSNIFFSLDGRIKIGDFGLVTDSSDLQYDKDNNLPAMDIIGAKDRHTRQVGTQLYMSPEQQKGLPYNYKVDIYSLGLILFELLLSFDTEMERICTLKDVRKNKFPPKFAESYPDEYQLLKIMLSTQPSKRPTTYGIKARPPLKQCPSTSKSTSQLQLHSIAPIAAVEAEGSGDHFRKPLISGSDSSDNSEWHFELPPRRKDSRSISNNGSSGSGSSQNQIFF
ncbi:eukaryotic translation initiation factor 2-alpha kinase-like [Ochlerotatus camptorhynchus]|uniref:eukaryotic translation initiation factor 2-alpha kinase-like n=1 Tax=Ochlerotatus camptorhynchus TaxID=644619 RepID=UPI0031D92A0F